MLTDRPAIIDQYRCHYYFELFSLFSLTLFLKQMKMEVCY